MTTITVGDRVSFTQRTTYRPYLHTVTGTVTWTDGRQAIVEPDSGIMPKLVRVRDLTRVEVEAAQDDIQDYLATCERPFELIADDYAETMLNFANDLGQVEL